MSISVNEVVCDLETGARYLVLWMDPSSGRGYWYDLESSLRTPGKFLLADVAAGEATGRYETQQFVPDKAVRAEETLTDTERMHRDRVWDVMKEALESEPEIYDRKSRVGLLEKVAEANGLKVPNLYRLLDQYWRQGKTRNAFIPEFSKRGGRGTARKPKERKPGRKSGAANAIGKVITDDDRRNFDRAIRKYYLSREKVSFKSVYERLLQDSYTIKSADGTGKLKLLEPSEVPSLRQFQYWYSKNRDLVTEQRKREGESGFELKGRGVLGRSDFGLMGPGAQYQIDATVGDVYLVSQFDRSNLIGRPVMYFVVDAFSRMVTGMDIGLEGPSWGSAMMAIANMAADKVAYCEEYGIKITEDEWPCRHVPAAMLGDRGEMESRNADNLVNMLGVRIVNAPPYRADLKGIIEQHFKTMNTNSVALLPGSVKPDASKRGGRDYRLDATLDIRQFTQIVIKCVLYYNNNHYMDYFEKNEAMIADSVEAIPVRLWDWGIRNCSGALRSFPEDTVRLAVMPTAKATVTGKGIRFKGLFYSCERAIRESWFDRARSKKSWQLDVSYDPRDMTNIFIWDKDDKTYDTCTLLDWNAKNAGKCLDEVIYKQRKEKLVAKQLEITETEAKVNLNAEIEFIVNEAKDMGRALPHKSKHKRVSQIKENRKQEREAMREALPTADAEPAAEQSSGSEEEISPTLRMIKEKLEERLRND
jgi:hypothetical protein